MSITNVRCERRPQHIYLQGADKSQLKGINHQLSLKILIQLHLSALSTARWWYVPVVIPPLIGNPYFMGIISRLPLGRSTPIPYGNHRKLIDSARLYTTKISPNQRPSHPDPHGQAKRRVSGVESPDLQLPISCTKSWALLAVEVVATTKMSPPGSWMKWR